MFSSISGTETRGKEAHFSTGSPADSFAALWSPGYSTRTAVPQDLGEQWHLELSKRSNGNQMVHILKLTVYHDLWNLEKKKNKWVFVWCLEKMAPPSSRYWGVPTSTTGSELCFLNPIHSTILESHITFESHLTAYARLGSFSAEQIGTKFCWACAWIS